MLDGYGRHRLLRPANAAAAVAAPAVGVATAAVAHQLASAAPASLSSSRVVSLDRDSLLHLFALMTPNDRIQCAATCRAWRKVADQPAAWRDWDKDPSVCTLADLQAIPTHFRPLLRRLTLTGTLNDRPVGALRLLGDFTSVIDLNVNDLALVEKFLQVQAATSSTAATQG